MKKIFTLISVVLFASSFQAQELARNKESAHEGGINTVAISADGSLILTGGNDMKTCIWNAKTGEKIKAFKANLKVRKKGSK